MTYPGYDRKPGPEVTGWDLDRIGMIADKEDE